MNTPDPNRAKVAPPPPPPPEIAAGLSQGQVSGGFDPKLSRTGLEALIALAGVVALGVTIVFAGGWIAAAMTPFVSIEVDKKLGEISAEQLAATSGDCTNPAAQKYVEELAAPLIQAAGDVPFAFKFRVADTEEVNAFALPGGYVTVNYGLLKTANSGEEVAGVVGHEIQHALLRHGTKRMLRQMGSGALMALFFGGSDLHSLGQIAGQLTGLSYDRSQESEADQEGVRLMVESGMDPSGLSTFFERLSEDAITPPAILSTHPDPGDRARLVSEAARGVVFAKLPSPSGISCHLPE